MEQGKRWKDPSDAPEIFLTPKGKKKRHPRPNVQEQAIRVYQKDVELVNAVYSTKKPEESDFDKDRGVGPEEEWWKK